MPVPPSVADLPVVGVLDAIGRALTDHREAVVVAAPGAGKTTVVPLWLLDQPWLGDGRIVMLEPRRLATRAAARRMATLLGEEVGGTVGYQTRDERRIGPSTRIEVVTEGVLTRRLQHDPDLPGVAVVIFDEVHERNLPTDLGLALALDVRRHLRSDLRLLAMSATPDTRRIAALLGDAAPAPVVASEGREYPVDIRSLPSGKGVRIEQATADAVLTALRDEPGDVLVFLPGIGEIRRVEGLLRDRVPSTVDVYPLAGALSLADQDLALTPSPAGRRRVVLSTDIAESSLTVAGVRVVVDAGLARVPRFDARTGMTRLTTVATSRASADQRAGRAGRTEPGVCYRLWSKLEQSTRLAHLPAEITQVDLSGLALELAVWNTPPEALSFIDPPPSKALHTARQLLTDLGALDHDGLPTATGRAMLALPVHPRLARMIVDAPPADRGLACVIAAVVDERDVLRGRYDELPADLSLRVRLVCGDGATNAPTGGRWGRCATVRTTSPDAPAPISTSTVSTVVAPALCWRSPTPTEWECAAASPASSSCAPAAVRGWRKTMHSRTNPSSWPPTSTATAPAPASAWVRASTPPSWRHRWPTRWSGANRSCGTNSATTWSSASRHGSATW